MDDVPDDYKYKRKRNTKAIVLIISVAAIISFAMYFSYDTKYVADRSDSIHATLESDITLNNGRIRASMINDGDQPWDIDSVELIGGKTNCWRLAKNVKPNATASVSCTAQGIEEGGSYSIVIRLQNVNNNDQKFMLSGIAEFRQN